MSCKGLKGDALKECKKKTPTWKNFAMANQARNNAEGVDSKRPATKRDSTQYKRGFQMGLKGIKPKEKLNFKKWVDGKVRILKRNKLYYEKTRL